MKLATARIGIVGVGAMGRALASGLLRHGLSPSCLRLSDAVSERLAEVCRELGVAAGRDNPSLVAESDVVLLAVKPGQLEAVMTELAPTVDRRPLWISIAAGVPLARVLAPLPDGSRAIRAMPNTPALVGEGATAFVASGSATQADRELAQGVFGAIGRVWEAPDESLLDAVTGLSGSGPAYVFVLLEALADAGVRAGLPRDAAQLLASQTVLGAARLALETGRHPGMLKDQVTSPGGTTIAGLAALERAGFRAAVHEAVAAATARSRELGG